MKPLTPNQYNFVCSLLAGCSQADAYAEAYPKSRNWAQKARASTANALLHKPHVWAFYSQERKRIEAALREDAEKKAVWDKQKSIDILTFVINAAVDDVRSAKRRQKEKQSDEPLITSASSNALIKSVVELNRILGIDAETNKEVDPVCIVDDYKGDDS